MRKKKVASCSPLKDNTLKQPIPPPNVPTFPMFIPFIDIQPKPSTVLPQPPLHFPQSRKRKTIANGKKQEKKGRLKQSVLIFMYLHYRSIKNKVFI